MRRMGRTTWATSLAALTLALGCAPYKSGDALVSPQGSRLFRCLEMHLAPYYEEISPEWVAIEYRIGNTCRQAVPIDLTAIRVEMTDGGRTTRLLAHDPRDELHAAALDGRARAREVIAYEFPLELELYEVPICVNLEGAADFEEPPPPYCFTWSRSSPFQPTTVY